MSDQTKFHLETTAGEMAAALKLAKLVCPKGRVNPIFRAVLLEDRRMSAINFDQQLSVPFGAVKMEGRMLVEGSKLELLKHLDADVPVTISGSDGVGVLSFAGGRYDLITYEVNDFPIFPVSTDDTEEISGNAATGLPQALAGVQHAISTEETRYYLNGVCFGAMKGEPCVVATDGHRMTWQNAHVPFPENWHGLILPTDAVTVMIKLGVCDAITVGFRLEKERTTWRGKRPDGRYPYWLRMEAGGAKLTTKLIDGTFPNWTSVVPRCLGGEGMADPNGDGSACKLVLPVAETRRALRRFLCVRPADQTHLSVTILPKADDGQIALACEADNQIAVEQLPQTRAARALGEDERLQTGFGVNVHYLATLLSTATGDELVLMGDRQEAYPNSMAGGPFGYVDDRGGSILMPVRTELFESKRVAVRMAALKSDGAGVAA